MVLSQGISKISITYLCFISQVGQTVNVGAEQNPWLALAAFRSVHRQKGDVMFAHTFHHVCTLQAVAAEKRSGAE